MSHRESRVACGNTNQLHIQAGINSWMGEIAAEVIGCRVGFVPGLIRIGFAIGVLDTESMLELDMNLMVQVFVTGKVNRNVELVPGENAEEQQLGKRPGSPFPGSTMAGSQFHRFSGFKFRVATNGAGPGRQ